MLRSGDLQGESAVVVFEDVTLVVVIKVLTHSEGTAVVAFSDVEGDSFTEIRGITCQILGAEGLIQADFHGVTGHGIEVPDIVKDRPLIGSAVVELKVDISAQAIDAA